MVIKVLRKTIMLGMGTLSLTKEKAEKVVEELVQKGEATSDEAKVFLNELAEKGEKERNALGNFIRTEFNKIRSEIGLVTADEYNQLEARILELEKKLTDRGNDH